MSGGKTVVEQKKEEAISKNELDPEFKGLVMGNYAGAQQRASSLQPFTGQLTAGFSPTQLQAQSQLSGVATNPNWAASNANATRAVSNIVNNPMSGKVSARPLSAPTALTPTRLNTPGTLTPTSITAGMLKDTNLDPYMNPFTKDVINTTMADQERSRQIARVSDAQKMSAGKAFGGSRSGVTAALTNEGYDRNTGSLIAGLNSDNFNQARGAASLDISNRLGADQFNTSNAMNVDASNVSNGMNADQFNITNRMNADQFNSQQDVAAQQASFDNGMNANQQTMTGAGQVLSMNAGDMALQQQQGGILSAVGDAQQGQQQAELDAAFAAYQNGQQLTLAQQQMLNSALGMIPQQGTVTSSGTSNNTSRQSGGGLTGMLGAAGSVMGGLGAMGVVI